MSQRKNSQSKPYLKWINEPESKVRFRYESEGGSHGGIAGKAGPKTHPTLKLINYHGGKPVFVQVSLYTEDKKQHILEFKGKKSEGCKSYIQEELRDDNTVVFTDLQIMSKKKDEIEKRLMDRKLNNLKDDLSSAQRDFFKKEYSKAIKKRASDILNSVRLYFVAFEADKPDDPLCSLFSEVISNQKAADKGDLKICRLSHCAGSWRGGEDIILLCSKVNKNNIKVKFIEVDENGAVLWENYGEFLPVDVHYQVAITLKTPPYLRNERKKVSIFLERDGELSEPREFTYIPDETSSKKRKYGFQQSETLSTPVNLILPENNVESMSSMSISSAESTSNDSFDTLNIVISQPNDDVNQMNGEIEIDMNLSDTDFSDFFENEDYPLPFDDLLSMLVPDQDGNILAMDAAFQNISLNDKCENKSNSLNFSKETLNSTATKFQQKIQLCTKLFSKTDDYCNTFLHLAVLLNKKITPILNMSLIAKIDIINKQNDKSQTALHIAVEKNKIEEVEILLKYGANPNIKDANGNNCYHIASRNNFCTILQNIINYSKFVHEVDSFNDEGLTAMHITIMQKNAEDIFHLLKLHMIDPNIVEKKAGKSLLHYAIVYQPSLVPKLLEMDTIDVNIQDLEGNTPLHIAVSTGNIGVVKQLLQSGANPLIKNFIQNYIDLENLEIDTSEVGQIPADLTTSSEISELLLNINETGTEDLPTFQRMESFQGLYEIPHQVLEKLIRILDEQMKWKKVVPFFCDEEFSEVLSLSPSPTRTLINFAKKQEKEHYIEKFKTVLECVGLRDAVSIMNEL